MSLKAVLFVAAGLRPAALFCSLALSLAGCDAAGDTATWAPEIDVDADGWSPDEGDCDDANAQIYPEQVEIWYDGVDSNCDGANDYDADADGSVGGPNGVDCDDADPAVFPGAAERCNDTDEDCDGMVDEDPVDAGVLYADGDRDGFGAGDALWAACWAPDGTTFAVGDCNDSDATSFIGGAEVCDGVDNDCDGVIDDNPDEANSWYRDSDGDGRGDPATLEAFCSMPVGWTVDGTDCDDLDPLSYGGAAEICDALDNDCDGEVDEGAVNDRVWFSDGDNDGFGGSASTLAACGRPAGFALLSTDCDDNNPSVYPAATEVCDEADNDCDGAVDNDAADAPAAYIDADLDGYGGEKVTSCAAAAGTVATGGDCDDGSVIVSPVGVEVCNGTDDDCDGATDEPDAEGAAIWYFDLDLDGYGVSTFTTLACGVPFGFAATAGDCDDTDPERSPGALEHCDGIDEDCDDQIDDSPADGRWTYADLDGDGFGEGEATVACQEEAGRTGINGDCDDTDAARSPTAAESDNQQDDDCDVLVDEDFWAVGDLVVTEIARQPYAGGEGTSTYANAQWFEVANTSSRAISLDGWFMAEQDGDGFYVSPDAGVWIEPGERTVLCYDDFTFADPTICAFTWGDSAWATPYFDATFYFDRDEDLIELSAGGVVFDTVHWTYGIESPDWPRVARYSAELDDDFIDDLLNDAAANWCSALTTDVWSDPVWASTAVDLGTPGLPNGTCD